MFRCVINLDSSVDRWIKFQEEQKRIGLEFERISAVYGRDLTDEQLAAVSKPRGVGYVYPMTSPEYGCFLSHRKAWQRIVESGERWGAIVEDDVYLADELSDLLSSDDWLPEDADVVQIWSAALKIRIKGSPVPLKNGYQLVKQCKPSSFGTVGYLISREAAQRALDGSQRMNCPVDYYLFSPWFPFVRKNQVFRLSIRPLALTSAPSEIGLRKKRQFKRPILRQLNPVRWFGQIRISFGKMFSTPFEVKEGTFHR